VNGCRCKEVENPIEVTNFSSEIPKFVAGPSKPRLLWIGDAACATGFARATHYTLEVLRETWDVSVLGLNYLGDPHSYPYPIYPCYPGGDAFGVRRTKEMVEKIRPDLVVVQNDPWNLPAYMKQIVDVPIVGVVAVDGKNCRATSMNGIALAIFWTKFGADEARAGGYLGPSEVIPLGVDLNIYKPMDKQEARAALGLPKHMQEGFIVGNVNRNQPRKRLDLMVSYFAEWVKTFEVEDAYLFLHVAPTGDQGYDVKQLMHYYGMKGKLILSEPNIGQGDPEELLVQTYNCFDVQATTTQGEGMGLTTLEGMACEVVQIAPRWSALGDWAKDAAVMVDCSEICTTPNMLNVIGGVPSRGQFVAELDTLYNHADVREDWRKRGLALAHDPMFNWRNIGERFAKVLEKFRVSSEKVANG